MSDKAIRVLLVEDNRQDFLLTRGLLNRARGFDFELEWQSTYEGARESIATRQHDVYLFDHHLGDRTGLELLREVMAEGSTTPAILFTVMSDPKLDREALEAGATDYLVKGQVDSVGLARSIRYSVERKRIELDLRRAKEEAEQATRSKSQFLANMSHELRTPLNGVYGMTDMLLQGELTADQRYCVDTIRTSCNNLLFIIDDILNFSRIEEGNIEVKPAVFNLEELVTGVVATFREQASKKGIHLHHRTMPAVPLHVQADPNLLRQILANLLTNALKFTEQGEISVTVDAKLGQGDRALLRFRIKDTGIGISKTDLDKVFGAFSQADASLTRRHGGVGLGLTVCRRLVDMLGGEISITSDEGVGTVVTFSFDTRIASGRKKAAPMPIRGLAKRLPLEILVVEDNEVNLAIMKHTLLALGYEPDLATHGREALAAISARGRKSPYDVLLLDLHMPEMDGFELMARIRQDDSEVKAPRVIAVTASVTDEIRRRCEAAGMVRYLKKPIVFDELVEALVHAAAVERSEGDEEWTHRLQGSTHVPQRPWELEPEESPEARSVNPRIVEGLRHLGGQGDRDLLGELVQSFRQRVPAILMALGRAVAQGNARELEEMAHALKGSTANLGAERMAQLCAKLEKLGESGTTTGAEEHLRDLEREFSVALEQLLVEVSGEEANTP